MFAQVFQRLFGDPWLGFNRLMTVRAFERRLGRCAACGTAYTPEPGSLLYVAASAPPYHTSGYTSRTHEVICALRALGANVHVLTRPGYPWDRKDRNGNAEGEETMVGEILYRHARAPSNRRPVLQFALQAATVIAAEAARLRVAAIHAASNHVNALPALLAARQLGIPFHYEMRGLWELTRVSRMPHYKDSQGYAQGLQLEGLVARHADQLFVISKQLGLYAQKHWGVPADRMTLLPNCVDPTRIVPADPAQVQPNRLGYAGSLICYEGLDTLIVAVSTLIKAGVDVRVDIVGDGEERLRLEAQVDALGLSERIRFHGKVPPESARAILGRCSLVCIPRKPFTVCKIVPPIKLVEAMAMAKPVIVPDLPVFRDELGVNPAAWFFTAGDAEDLARVIEMALHDHIRLAAMGESARQYAATQRRWQDFLTNVLPGRRETVDLNGR